MKDITKHIKLVMDWWNSLDESMRKHQAFIYQPEWSFIRVNTSYHTIKEIFFSFNGKQPKYY